MYLRIRIYFISALIIFYCGCKKNNQDTNSIQAQAATDKSIIHLSTIADVSALKELTETLRKAYQRLGYKIQIHQMPALRSIHESNSGDFIDGEVGRTIHAQSMMKDQIRIPVVMGHIEVSAFSKNQDIQINGWESLQKREIISVRGYWLIQQKLKDKSQLTETVDASQALSFLDNGRAELAVLVRKIGEKIIFEKNIKDIYVIEPPIERIPIYHFVNKKHKNLVPDLTEALSEISGNSIESE